MKNGINVSWRYKCPLIYLLLISCIYPFHSLADVEADQVFTPQSALEYAFSHHPLLIKLELEAEQSKLSLREVKDRFIFPEFSLSSKTGVVPEARGDIFYSPDKQTDLDGWGPFFQLKIQLAQPLLTFGKKSSALTLARKGIDLQRIENNSQLEELIQNVLVSYWSVLAAQQAQKIATELKEKYRQLTDEVVKRLHSDDSEVDDSDYLEVKSNRFLVEKIFIRSNTEFQVARQAFNLALGRNLDEPVKVLNQIIPALGLNDGQMNHQVSRACDDHSDVQKLKKVIEILQEKVNLTRNKKKPTIFLAGGFEYGYAPHRDDQTNPFAVDNFNYLGLGAYLGFSWNLNFFRKNISLLKSKLAVKANQQSLKLLRMSIKLQLMKAFLELKQDADLLIQARFSLKAAKNWLRLGLDNWELGIGEVERLVKAYNAYYQMKGVEIAKILDLRRSLTRFAFILGDTRLCLKWTENGKVSFN